MSDPTAGGAGRDGRGPSVAELRVERQRARDAIGVAAGRLVAARAAVRDASTRREGAGDPDQPWVQQQRAVGRLEEARSEEAGLRERIDAVTMLSADPLEAIVELSARYPLVLLPVRLETRFRRGAVEAQPEAAGELLVRIYPDAVLIDQHEPLLTAGEQAAGQRYWRRAFADGGERDAWTVLLGEVGEQRAAWIVERTAPEDLDALGTGAEPVFPSMETRPDGWHRAPEARGLPERWVVTAQRGEHRTRVVSEPVREGLAMTLRLSGDDPGAPDSGGDPASGVAGLEPSLSWVHDFDEAVRAGMAVRLPVTEEDLSEGFETLLVVGVRTTDPPEAQAEELAQLLTAHRFARGLAFVPQGSRTNNTAGHKSAHPSADPTGAESFPVARGGPLAAPGTDGRRTAAALGIPAAVFDHVQGADRDEQTPAQAMVDSLWPAATGYFLDQFLAPHPTRRDVDSVRAWAHDWLRARGPLPALRVGPVPYGLLPVAAVTDWEPAEREGAPPRLVEVVRRAEELWHHCADRAPHLGRTPDDPDRDLVAVLATDASTQSVEVRPVLGIDLAWNILTSSGVGLADWDVAQQRVVQRVRELLGEDADFDPRVAHLSLAQHADDFAGPLVTGDPLSETDPLAFDYVAWLRTATPADLHRQDGPPAEGAGRSLLYLVLRHALLAQYDRAARELLALRQLALPFEDREPELLDVLTQQQDGRPLVPLRTAWDRFQLRVPGVTGDRTLGEFLADPRADRPSQVPPDVRPVLARVRAHRSALRSLEGLPTAELERLFTETLDTSSHRVDAWVTSLATRRLALMRDITPEGVHLGCYGWVQDLHADQPQDTGDVVLPDGATVRARTDSDGFVHAPSMLHAATAAVLRSAHRSRSDGAGPSFAVDLSSRRTRAALALLDAVRDGQPLGAVLGHRFERGLHDGHPGVELHRFIDTFRNLYPQVAHKARRSGEPADAVAARTVVDGLALLRAQQAGSIPFGSGELPQDGPHREAIQVQLDLLEEAVDAVSDLLLAESVHQVLRGSADGAAATLDTLGRGHRPPEPAVASAPRSGTVLHHRVALLFGDGTPSPGWETVPATPRSTVAPELDAWLGRLLGPPDTIECRAQVGNQAPRTVTVRDLGVHPVDLVAMARAADAGAGPGELDRRIAWHVRAAVGSDTNVIVDHAATGTGGATPMAVALELAAAAAAVLGFGRPLEARDLLPPELDASAADALDAELNLDAELDARAATAVTLLTQAHTNLQDALSAAGDRPTELAAVRSALDTAARLGVPGAFPTSNHTADDATAEELRAQAGNVSAELAGRLAAAGRAPSSIDVLREVFARTLPAVPRFQPLLPDVVGPALTTEPGMGPDPDAQVEGWLSQLSRVRPPLDAWRDVQVFGRALGRRMDRPRIAQLPLRTDPEVARWAALPFEDGGRPPSGLVSLTLLGSHPPPVDQPWAGVLLDTWPEVLPSPEEETAIAFHFDAPRAEAPQAVLLAVPSRPAETWNSDMVERTLLSTLRLVRSRALDLGDLGAYGQLVPMVALAANPQNATVSTSFTGMLRAHVVVEGPE